MTRYKDDAALQEVLRRRGYRIREQSGSERVDTTATEIARPLYDAMDTLAARRQTDEYLELGFPAISEIHLPEKVKLDETPERGVLEECLAYLKTCRRIAWYQRMNTGGAHRGGQYVAFGFTGCPDIMAQHRDGRFIAIECKRPGKMPTSDQWQFLNNVARNNGIAIVATDVADLKRVLQ